MPQGVAGGGGELKIDSYGSVLQFCRRDTDCMHRFLHICNAISIAKKFQPQLIEQIDYETRLPELTGHNG